jgi:penicillin-binding protein 1C
MFDILNLLPFSDVWFDEPDGGVWADVCKDSGHLAGPGCPAVSMLLPERGLESDPCPYHGSGEFVLPPAMEWFYRQSHPEYTGARKSAVGAVIQFIYPQSGAVLALPRQLSGAVEGIVFRVAHHRQDATLWWHMDNTYVGETTLRHEMLLAPAPGHHVLTVVDQDGSVASVSFTIAE